MKKSVAIIGGGVSGLTAGIYAQLNGLSATIYEKNPSVGGLCTGWYRKGRYIDGCIHWLTGTKEGTELNKLWKTTNAINDSVDIINLDSFGSFDYQGTVVTFWTDLDKAEKEFLEISPEDKKEIRRFFKMVRIFVDIEEPLSSPVDMLPLRELVKYGLSVIKHPKAYLSSMKISTDEYAKRFKNPAIRYAIKKLQPGPGNLFSMIYCYATVVDKNGGIPVGGSKPMVERMKDRFLRLGGELKVNSPVKKLMVNGKDVKGLILANGNKIFADYVISCVDANHLLTDVLKGYYKLPIIDKRLKEYNKYSSPSCCLLSFSVEGNLPFGGAYSFQIKPFIVGASMIDTITIRNGSYDSATYYKNGKITCNVLIDQYSDDYEIWSLLNKNKESYLNEKKYIAEKVMNAIKEKFADSIVSIECLDVATPITMNRYVNAFRGSYMSFLLTKKNRMYCYNHKIRGLNNLYLAGQWMQTPGGLPLAALCGKYAIQKLLCEHRKELSSERKIPVFAETK